jgi:hypothetical protein
MCGVFRLQPSPDFPRALAVALEPAYLLPSRESGKRAGALMGGWILRYPSL